MNIGCTDKSECRCHSEYRQHALNYLASDHCMSMTQCHEQLWPLVNVDVVM